jgi:ABC-type dipeptide/oligopeptide/nickel transport system permease subunit
MKSGTITFLLKLFSFMTVFFIANHLFPQKNTPNLNQLLHLGEYLWFSIKLVVVPMAAILCVSLILAISRRLFNIKWFEFFLVLNFIPIFLLITWFKGIGSNLVSSWFALTVSNFMIIYYYYLFLEKIGEELKKPYVTGSVAKGLSPGVALLKFFSDMVLTQIKPLFLVLLGLSIFPERLYQDAGFRGLASELWAKTAGEGDPDWFTAGVIIILILLLVSVWDIFLKYWKKFIIQVIYSLIIRLHGKSRISIARRSFSYHKPEKSSRFKYISSFFTPAALCLLFIMSSLLLTFSWNQPVAYISQVIGGKIAESEYAEKKIQLKKIKKSFEDNKEFLKKLNEKNVIDFKKLRIAAQKKVVQYIGDLRKLVIAGCVLWWLMILYCKVGLKFTKLTKSIWIIKKSIIFLKNVPKLLIVMVLILLLIPWHNIGFNIPESVGDKISSWQIEKKQDYNRELMQEILRLSEDKKGIGYFRLNLSEDDIIYKCRVDFSHIQGENREFVEKILNGFYVSFWSPMTEDEFLIYFPVTLFIPFLTIVFAFLFAISSVYNENIQYRYDLPSVILETIPQIFYIFIFYTFYIALGAIIRYPNPEDFWGLTGMVNSFVGKASDLCQTAFYYNCWDRIQDFFCSDYFYYFWFIAISSSYFPVIYRQMQNDITALKKEKFIDAMKILGFPDYKIKWYIFWDFSTYTMFIQSIFLLGCIIYYDACLYTLKDFGAVTLSLGGLLSENLDTILTGGRGLLLLVPLMFLTRVLFIVSRRNDRKV